MLWTVPRRDGSLVQVSWPLRASRGRPQIVIRSPAYAMPPERHPLVYGRLSARRLALRPIVAPVAILFLVVGAAGLAIAGRNFTFPAQDADQMPAAMALDNDLKQPWLDFSGPLLLVGVLGVLLIPFSFRLRPVSR